MGISKIGIQRLKENHTIIAIFITLLFFVAIDAITNEASGVPTCLNCPITLPSLSTWDINAGGFTGQLLIIKDHQGNLQGKVFNETLFGFYDENIGKITFMRALAAQTNLPHLGNPPSLQIYTGYIFVEKPPTGGTKWTIDGYFQWFPLISPRNTFGWQATLFSPE